PGHPLGFHSPAYVGEVALCQVLADPTGELTALRTATRAYPPALRAAVVENARWEAPFVLAAARKGARSADTAYV
ncbi:DNA polymerase subunit beta, partial [Streptomyces sp. SID11233]|nr:DNA polymerase subunit beta [Streptomyces sp. SID11233]